MKEGFKLYAKERGHYYPQGLLSCLYNLQEKTIYDFNFVDHMNERLCALEYMKKLTKKDVIIFDRGYFSYLLFYKALESNIQAIFRIQIGGGNNKKIIRFLRSDKNESVIEYSPSKPVIDSLKQEGYNLDFKPITMRLIKHKIGETTYLYATTLFNKESFPQQCFAEIYHGRWGIEELYKISKIFIEIEESHSKTARGVKQELYAHILLINLSRFFEFEVQTFIQPSRKAVSDKKEKSNFENIFNPITMIKINFKNCLLVVGRYLEVLTLKSSILLDQWCGKIRTSIVRVRQRIRLNRWYPRISHKPRGPWVKKVNKQHAKGLTECH